VSVTSDAQPIPARIEHAHTVLLGALSCGLARGALREAVSYSQQRSQFGHQIGFYGEIQTLLATASSQVHAIGSIVRVAADNWDRATLSEADAARLGLVASRLAVDVSDRAQHVFGGYGQMAEFPVGRFVRDARAAARAGGTRADHVAAVARELQLPQA
jgi:alkylation response protein AidB-like acyl-CoA dehydrogenase